MRDIHTSAITDEVKKLCMEANWNLEPDMLRAFDRALGTERSAAGRQVLQTLKENAEMARTKRIPYCQDTGFVVCFVELGQEVHVTGGSLDDAINKGVSQGYTEGYLRASIVRSPFDRVNTGDNTPAVIHVDVVPGAELKIMMMAKGGGCENVGAQYSLPNEKLKANRDLDGCRKVILDAVLQAQGKGCGPGILGVCIGGDRATGYEHSKLQFLRKLDDQNENQELNRLERDIVETANKLGIGPMGFGGKTTLLSAKIGILNRLPASYFVSVSYMCWAYRRQGVTLDAKGKIEQWLY